MQKIEEVGGLDVAMCDTDGKSSSELVADYQNSDNPGHDYPNGDNPEYWEMH
jgi:hypothetical protein